MEKILREAPGEIKGQLSDNISWIKGAQDNKLVVGSQARILYAHAEARINIALAFNRAIRNKKTGPIILGRDHHDVSGTDSPYRETSNIYDGSAFTADMAIHNVIGDSFRGATWVSIHNGGGVGWGEAINGGFGMVLDGTRKCDQRIVNMLHYDVHNGLARRAWARNQNAIFSVEREMNNTPSFRVTLPNAVNDDLLDAAIG
jgi:urocanate hydratase